MNCPLYYVGETVWYVPNENSEHGAIKCLVIQADYYQREENKKYCERYIIKPLDDNSKYFMCHHVTHHGIEYKNTNRCAGEYLRKMKQIKPLKNINKHKMV